MLLQPQLEAEVALVCRKGSFVQYFALKNYEKRDVGSEMIFQAYFANIA